MEYPLEAKLDDYLIFSLKCQPGILSGAGFDYWQGMAFLTSISLQNSSAINDFGLKALAKLGHLRSLNLKGCREVTNAGLLALKPLQGLTNLRIQVRSLKVISWCRSILNSGSKGFKYRFGQCPCCDLTTAINAWSMLISDMYLSLTL